MILVYIDGACGPTNPRGAMGAAALIEENGSELHRICEGYAPSDRNSNNLAEYLALYAVLKWLSANFLHNYTIIIHSDNQMLISQMNEAWGIRSGFYQNIADACFEMKHDFSDISFKWIPRHMNTRADVLSKHALRKGLTLPNQKRISDDTF